MQIQTILIILGQLALLAGLAIGLGMFIARSLRVRDMSLKICLVLCTIFAALVPFTSRILQYETFAWQRADGTFVSADKVEDGREIETKQDVAKTVVPYSRVTWDADALVMRTNKDVRVWQEYTFKPGRWRDALKYGIDLAGGTNLIYEAVAMSQTAKPEEVKQTVDTVNTRLANEGLKDIEAKPADSDRFSIHVADDKAAATVKSTMEKLKLKDIEYVETAKSGKGFDVVYRASTGGQLTNETMQKLIGAVNKRINPAGTKEVVVRQVGSNRIEVIVPGADPAAVAEVKDAITRLGNLEFSVVANSTDHAEILAAGRVLDPALKDVRDADNVIVAQWLPVAPNRDDDGVESPREREFSPTDERIAVRQIKNRPSGYYEVLILKNPPEEQVTGQFLSSSKADIQDAAPVVQFNFNYEGAQRFENLTRKYKSTNAVDRRLAVILDGAVYSAPNIQAVISSSGVITGMGSRKAVDALVNVLNAGSLPVELTKEPVAEFTVSPTLGADVQQKGMLSLWVSSLVVVVFMFGYYRVAGLVADFAMLLNLLFITGIMALFNAAFTLPGLAGLVLGAGMAVDANVLIYERIREELQRGASLRMAIHNGFDRAMGAIIDSNLTTILTAVILYAVGTEQVKGFAVSLFIGLVMNLYTAVYVSRIILTVLERSRLVKNLPMAQMIGKTSTDFIAMRHMTALGSIVVIVIGLIAFIARGQSNYDIDFNGGTMVTMLFTEPVETDEVRKTMSADNDIGGDITLERLTLPGEAAQGTLGRRFRMRTVNQDEKLVEQKIAQLFQGKLVKHSLAYTPLKTIPLPAAPKTDAKDKVLPPPADHYAGGVESELTIQTQGGDAEIAPGTLMRYLVDELKKNEVDEPENLVAIEGLAGSGTTVAEGKVKLFHSMKLKAQKAIPKDKLEKSLAAVRSFMDQKPLFDEVTTFSTSVAEETKLWAVVAILMSLVAIVVYIWFRFENMNYGIAAVIALAHDVLVALGALSVGAYLSNTPIGPLLLLNDFKINMAIIAAFLTIVGYSLNDTIVIFDRLRELRGKAPAVTRDMINLAVNQTLSRTILTTLTVLLTVFILYVLGGEGIHGFAFTMLMGCIAGTYSTIFIANPIVLWLTDRSIANNPNLARQMKSVPAMTHN